MSAWKAGKVKWFRDDGVGYIIPQEEPESSILVDKSALKSKENLDSLEKGQKVRFKSKNILGREIATDVQPL